MGPDEARAAIESIDDIDLIERAVFEDPRQWKLYKSGKYITIEEKDLAAYTKSLNEDPEFREVSFIFAQLWSELDTSREESRIYKYNYLRTLAVARAYQQRGRFENRGLLKYGFIFGLIAGSILTNIMYRVF